MKKKMRICTENMQLFYMKELTMNFLIFRNQKEKRNKNKRTENKQIIIYWYTLFICRWPQWNKSA